MKAPIQFLLIVIVSISLGCNLPSPAVGSPPPAESIDTIVPPTAESLPSETAITPSLPTLTPEPTSTSTLTPSPTPNVPTALFVMNANCRSGPDKSKEAVMSFIKGESSEILGRNEELDNTWWLVKVPNSSHKCWVSTVTVQVIGNYNDIPTLHPPY